MREEDATDYREGGGMIYLDLIFADETGSMVIARDDSGAILNIGVDVVRNG